MNLGVRASAPVELAGLYARVVWILFERAQGRKTELVRSSDVEQRKEARRQSSSRSPFRSRSSFGVCVTCGASFVYFNDSMIRARLSKSAFYVCAALEISSRSGLLMCVAVGVPTRQVRTFGSRRAAFPPCLRTAGGLSLVQRGADLRLFWMLCREGNSGWDIVLLVRSRGKEAPPSCSPIRGLNSRERARGAGLRIFAGRCRRWRGLLACRPVSLLTRDGRHPEANRGPSAARRQTSPTAEQLCRK